MVAENALSVHDLIWPVFVIEGENRREPVASLPGVERLTIDLLIEDVKKARDKGIPAIALFPIVPLDKKDENGSEAANGDNLICRALQALKQCIPDMGLITDVALDPYTSHGHDGILDNGLILNDETLDVLARQALTQAQAGADVIAPSDMMDGRVARIRQDLDQNGYDRTLIMSYAAKYASAFYGPFRDAVQSGNLLKGDKKTYQMDPRNTSEAIKEIGLDISEGADMLIVKPGTPYLDIIRETTRTFSAPVFAYHVSGEFAMLKAAHEKGWADYQACLLETAIAFKRAGCSGFLTYGALDIADFIASP